MNKGILIRGSVIIGLFLIIIGAAVGCSLIKKDAVEPMLSNGDEAYLTLEDFTITNAQLWEVMRNVDGLNYLMSYIDGEVLLKDTIALITDQEVADQVKYLTYKTESEDLIAEIMADDEINQAYIDAFEENLIVTGFDPSDPADLRSYVEIGIAKTKLAREYMLNATGEEIYAISGIELAEYFEASTYGDVCALEIRFESDNEANLVFDHFDFVPNFNLGIGKYVGTIDIELVSSDDFILDENTEQMTDEEVFSAYVKMYNYMNPNLPQIPEAITQENFCNDFSDIATFNYDDMIKDKATTDPLYGLANYIFGTLKFGVEDDQDTADVDEFVAGNRFSYTSKVLGESSVYAYKISETDKVLYDTLSDEDLLIIKNDMLDLITTAEIIESVVDEIYEDSKLEIYDPYLVLDYKFAFGTTFDNDGSETIVAKIGDVEITTNQLFEYMENRVGVYYAIEIAKTQMALLSPEYIEIYGDDHDYMNSKQDEIAANRDELRSMRTTFAQNGFAQNGYSSANYTWQEFIYLAFDVTSESDAIVKLFVLSPFTTISGLQAQLVYPTLNYSYVADYIETQATEYFSLNVEHLLIYVDKDLDFAPDDFDEYLEGLTVDELAEYELLKTAFDNLLFTKMNNDLDFDDIVTEYEDSLMDDETDGVVNEWAQFKRYGFKIMTQNLTPPDQNGIVTSLNHINSKVFDETFQVSLKRVYDAYVAADELADPAITEFLDTQITETAFGIHLILASEGSAFNQFSSEYDPTDDTTVTYSTGSENGSHIPTEAQIALYNRINYATIGGGLTLDVLPPDVYLSIDAYYGSVFDSYFTQTGYSIVAVNYMLDNITSFSSNNGDNIQTLEDILEVLNSLNFDDKLDMTE